MARSFLHHAVLWCGLALSLTGWLPARAQGVGPIQFRDATVGSGVDTGIGATGVSTFDFTEDGLDDLTLARRDAPPALLRNNGDGTFTDVTADTGISSSGNFLVPVWVDINQDGHADLFFGSPGMSRNALWLNQGDLTFVDVADAWGLDPRARVGTATFGDFSGDGFPDLFLGVKNAPDKLYRNAGGTSFEDVSEAYGIGGDPLSIPMQATWIDVDEDGDQDLFVMHDEEVLNFLYINEGGTALVDRAEALGIKEVGSGNSMGVAWGDPDRDGDLDAYVTRIGIAGFYRFDRTWGRFYDEATPWRVAQNGTGWGTYFADLDNDGDEDLVAVHSATAGFQPPVLFVNQNRWFDPVLEAGDFRFLLSDMGMAVADFNDDGRLDLFVANSRGEHRLLLNVTEPVGNWLTVELRSTQSRPGAIGARLELDVDGVTLLRILQAGDGYVSQNTYRTHFGLGEAAEAQALRVRWPDGTWQSFGTLSAGVRHVVHDGLMVTETETTPSVLMTSALEVWPNPATGSFDLQVRLPVAACASWTLVDLLGREVKQGRMEGDSGPGQARVALDGVSSGVYWVVVRAGSTTLRRSVVVR